MIVDPLVLVALCRMMLYLALIWYGVRYHSPVVTIIGILSICGAVLYIYPNRLLVALNASLYAPLLVYTLIRAIRRNFDGQLRIQI